MLDFTFNKPAGAPLRVLALGAHCDDIEIGCGGTLMRLIEQYPDLEVLWVVFSSNTLREAEARRSAALFLNGLHGTRVEINRFRNGYFPYVAADIKDYFETLKTSFDPDLVFTHTRDDRHQDHRTIAELTWNTWRNHFILEYEIPKYEGDLGHPNFFVPLPAETAAKKIDRLMEFFVSEQGKQWFTRDTFAALMRIRGIESGASEGQAEAFYASKLCFNTG